jgi:amino-acid N-acetyltransferase
MSLNIRPATPADWLAIAALLTRYNLPLDGAQESLADFIVAAEADRLVGVAGLERYADAGLLRSVAVADRHHGLGGELVRRLIDQARQDHLSSLVLLTTTAAGYFPRFGFQHIPRDAAPEPVKESVEFQSACPDTAAVMLLRL